MSHTNQTVNLGLPQFVSEDYPNWLTDVNGAMQKIDEYSVQADNKFDEIDIKSETTDLDISTIKTNIETLNTNYQSVQSSLSQVEKDVETVEQKVRTLTSDYEDVDERVSVLESEIQDISSNKIVYLTSNDFSLSSVIGTETVSSKELQIVTNKAITVKTDSMLNQIIKDVYSYDPNNDVITIIRGSKSKLPVEPVGGYITLPAGELFLTVRLETAGLRQFPEGSEPPKYTENNFKAIEYVLTTCDVI